MDDADSSFTNNKPDQTTISQYQVKNTKRLHIEKICINLKITIGQNQIWHKYLLILERKIGVYDKKEMQFKEWLYEGVYDGIPFSKLTRRATSKLRQLR